MVGGAGVGVATTGRCGEDGLAVGACSTGGTGTPETCQFGRGAGELPPLPPRPPGASTLSLPGVVPIAAGLSCGISLSGGGAIVVFVHGASASATSIGVA